MTGKIALVTGGSRGIGAAIAREFARNGMRVAVHGRDATALAHVVAEITAVGGVALAVHADVTKFEEVDAVRHQIEDAWGPIDVLVANAGGSQSIPGPLEQITEGDWRASIDGNLTATFLTIKSVLPRMKERMTGAIVTISSASARRPHPQSLIPYAAAKAGIQMLTQHLAAQTGPFGIRVNCIAPEMILTERNASRIPAAQQVAMGAAHSLRRLGTPEDVARVARFLVSDESAWITGVILDVDGGASIG